MANPFTSQVFPVLCFLQSEGNPWLKDRLNFSNRHIHSLRQITRKEIKELHNIAIIKLFSASSTYLCEQDVSSFRSLKTKPKKNLSRIDTEPHFTPAKIPIRIHTWTTGEKHALPISLRQAIPPKRSLAAENLLKFVMCWVF